MKIITRKALKSSRYHMLHAFRHHCNRITVYIRKGSTVVADAAEAVTSVAEAIVSTTQTFWQRVKAFVRRMFGRPERAAA